jgi:hypothetical protein
MTFLRAAGMTSANVALLAVYMQDRPNYRARRRFGGEPEIAMNHVASELILHRVRSYTFQTSS